MKTEELLKLFNLNIEPTVKVSTLTVAKQQIVEIIKAISYNSRILIMDEPTRGIGVGAKSEVYNLLNDLAAQGKAIIVISSELP